ncbi:hypothetical protein ACFPLB_01370 [Aquamicrobium segne]|uniref:PilZ domain-containing protein n=1 Tax=Aquamicrobium segne TaxID=469547 RepID=A0ABW0GW13_9HYPH
MAELLKRLIWCIMGTEQKRKLRRLRSFKGGKVVLESRAFAAVECTIKDINSRGAKIHFSEVTLVDKRLELIILPENHRVSATCRWQNGREAGLMFDTPVAWLVKHDQPEGDQKISRTNTE